MAFANLQWRSKALGGVSEGIKSSRIKFETPLPETPPRESVQGVQGVHAPRHHYYLVLPSKRLSKLKGVLRSLTLVRKGLTTWRAHNAIFVCCLQMRTARSGAAQCSPPCRGIVFAMLGESSFLRLE